MTAPYASNSAPDAEWYSSMTKFLDRCNDIGFMVHFQLIAFETLDNSPEVMGNITEQVNRFKGHPATFGW